MKIHGTVTDATEEKPLAQAKVVLYVGETELATLHTSKDGTFELEQDLDQHVGEDLICKATKAQFKPGETAYKIGTDDIGINIELEATKPLKTEPVIPTPPPDKPKSNKNIIMIGGAVCAVLLVAIVIYLIIPPEPAKVEYNVVLLNTGNNKIKVIRTIRGVTGAKLKETNDLVENLPQTIKKYLPKAEADRIKMRLESVGAEVRVELAK